MSDIGEMIVRSIAAKVTKIFWVAFIFGAFAGVCLWVSAVWVWW